MATSDEWALARRGVGLLDRRDFGVLELTGRDRATFLHALLRNEIKALRPGEGGAAPMLDVPGKVQVVVFVWLADDRIFVVTPPAMAEKVAEALDHYLFSAKVVFRGRPPETGRFVLAGPKARATIEGLAGATPPETAWSHAATRLGETPVRLGAGGGGGGGGRGGGE